MTEVTVDAEKLVADYLRLRDHKADAKKEFDEAMRPVNKAMGVLEARMMQMLNDQNMSSVKTTNGTFHTRMAASCTVKDRDAFYEFAASTDNLELMDIKANKTRIREAVQEGIHVPGVDFTETKLIGVRRS